MSIIISYPHRLIQKLVDRVGMYRVVSGTLGILVAISVLGGALGYVPYTPLQQLFAVAVALWTALVLNWIIAVVGKIPANHESAVITALILFFLAAPGETVFASWPLVLAVAVATISKYVIVYKRQHILNPAALGAVALSLTGIYSFGWWIANPFMFVPLVLLGSLVVTKVRRWVPVLSFVGVSLIIYLAESLSYGLGILPSAQTFFVSWPTLFLAFYMLTEPFTMPATKESQFLYGGVVGFLSNSSLAAILFPISPELALVLANIFTLPWRLKQKLFLTMLSKRMIAKDTWEFTFEKPAGFSYKAGQYLEWMLPHENADSRGERRYFTIVSSPTEDVVRLALKYVENGSSYKSELAQLQPGEQLIASQLAGDFLLPKTFDKKLGFIAGGIGVTPFVSHTSYLQDIEHDHDVVLLYCVNTQAEIAYAEHFAAVGKKMPLKMIAVVAKEEVQHPHEQGFVTAELLAKRVPDYLERHWYLSGPPPMVNAYTDLLVKTGIPKKQIKTDFFPGLA